MPIQIPNHGHCAICGKAIAFVPTTSTDAEARTCSKECKGAFEERRKKAKRNVWTLYGLMALAFLVLVLSLTNPSLFGG
jgi:predicted nucleic acid-binding Zn ribbon protein